ncbi:HAD family hydrolase [Peredibacter starrii]|uniref:phosphoglycolate phosphatase n=1 Tax=Peredibacter starrii TaxID=28202 RepID=A0AAX4HR96_9BACT|nr:HAD hydrolase-like protein [Peredibacter starrii]WPU65819.1 HAD hydrolase-like protein [Peredibacter starrii]
MSFYQKLDLNSYSSYIFDCDGVIFDSNQLKSDAFVDVLDYFGFSEKVKSEFINYHQANGGVSRYVKFKYLITNLLKQEFDENLYEKLLMLYSSKCVDLYGRAQFVPGVENFIKHSKLPQSVASGSDEQELNVIFKDRGISECFDLILGSPKTKSQCVDKIMKNLKQPKRTAFFGDSYSDYAAAAAAGCDFIFVSQFSEARDRMLSVCQSNNCFIIENFEGLL